VVQDRGRETVFPETGLTGSTTGGKLDFGPWEQIFYGEFDGGRKKRALIKIILCPFPSIRRPTENALP
jgi:hypothetical protein